ncbi:2-dehydro-3-deoxygalactonokinase [Oryzibacter oryziterrae]|uniref:2-dehydro-3-deoxygalactonokinase n=1 Tax=Oryzibacter oryziterrae TaxID=2766474 RepID=UPI001F4603E8|nr:2-dehydro-3-deoxygalactonokinase [Oryzibacter oryziterrae]
MAEEALETAVAKRPLFVAVDWGTSRFRAYLVASDGTVLDVRSCDDGVAQVKNGAFEPVLLRECGDWLTADPALPVVMAGMIGSRNGWREAPYAPCPAGLAEIAAAGLTFKASQGSPISIIPGLIDRSAAVVDVMRGEETQILGAGDGDAIVILPGTHSKWALRQGGRITTFRSFMTGEFFALLTQHSVLRLLAEDAAAGIDTTADFDRGLAAASADGGLTNRAFHARTLVLGGDLAATGVKPYLSGLLIGSEVHEAIALMPADLPIVLVAAGVIADNYSRALAAKGRRASLISGEQAFLSGLARILQSQQS